MKKQGTYHVEKVRDIFFCDVCKKEFVWVPKNSWGSGEDFSIVEQQEFVNLTLTGNGLRQDFHLHLACVEAFNATIP